MRCQTSVRTLADSDAEAWTPALLQCWRRIERHPLGGGDTQALFIARLAREQVWSIARASAAVREYRRFALLAVAGTHAVTPSHAVDAVWHLHLLFTRDYWLCFCPQALGFALHHDPETRPQDGARHRDQYARTCDSYRRFFGPPPPAFWPTPSKVRMPSPASRRMSPSMWVRRVREHAARHLRRMLPLPLSGLVLALLPGPVFAAGAFNPLDWSGGDFLALYLGLMLLVAIGSMLMRRMLRRRVDAPNRLPGESDNYEKALLVGGAQRVIDTAVVDLHQRGVLQWDSAHNRFERIRTSEPLTPLLATIADAMDSPTALRQAWRGAARAIGPIQATLVKRGLWLDPGSARRVAWLSSLPSIALLGLGVAKIGVGLARDKPVGILAVLCLLTAVFALAMLFGRPGRSRAGDQEVARLRATHRVRMKHRGKRERDSERDSDLVYAVAIGGTALLAGTSLFGYHQARAATTSGSSDSSGGADGDSGGGSGCGGCGGGGD